jgi:deoxyribose-phosphate aldolase
MPYSNNGDFEQLVEQITDVIYARLNGDAADQEKMCGLHLGMFSTAARSACIGWWMPARPELAWCSDKPDPARDWASLIDHTLLKPDATQTEIKHLCEEAAQYHFASFA